MSFFKENKRTTSIWVVFSFLFLLTVSSFPLKARSKQLKPQTAMSGYLLSAQVYEQEAASAPVGKKKSKILPILLGLAAAGAVAALLVFVVFKSKYNPEIEAEDFVAGVNNPYLPLVPGQVMRYRTTTAEGNENVTITITHDTKVILGVTCMVVHDVVTVEGNITEDTWDWYAQDKEGSVWYFGEDTKKWENGVMSTEGSWEAGVDGAKPGIVMWAVPGDHVSEIYRQEYRKDVAEDKAEVLGLNETVTTLYGTFSNCVKTKDYSDLEPDVVENKYFAPGVGNVLTVTVKGGTDREELIAIENH
jgi:hypothetical protein